MEIGKPVLDSYPRRIVFELTSGCNLKCVMCGRRAAEFSETLLDMNSFYALEPLFDTVEEVTLMGWGEPTIHPNFVEMLQAIHYRDARLYFCTNGMRLPLLTDAIFDNEVDILAVSVDGARPGTNNRIRAGSDLTKINGSLREIVRIKRSNHLKYPYMNYVFCAMKDNLDELLPMVEMTAEVGLEELKVVYLTAFDESSMHACLWNCQNEVEEAFNKAAERAKELGVLLELPYVQGKDPAQDMPHRECYASYRDFFLGSDGFVRPCMTTASKLLKYDPCLAFMDIWNSESFVLHRKTVNSADMCRNCRNCYQSSHCNWNQHGAFVQLGEKFAPEWEGT
ncbi:MAG: radical SAM protein [Firmicutes bacterium]|nr:radical SAM protein [Bacillota bacterium]